MMMIMFDVYDENFYNDGNDEPKYDGNYFYDWKIVIAS